MEKKKCKLCGEGLLFDYEDETWKCFACNPDNEINLKDYKEGGKLDGREDYLGVFAGRETDPNDDPIDQFFESDEWKRL
jgi:hypothetical protein